MGIMRIFAHTIAHFNLQNDRLLFVRCYMVIKRLAESVMKPYFIRSY